MKKNKSGYYQHCIALNEEDEYLLQKARSQTGLSLNKILMSIIHVLAEDKIPTVESI